MFKHLKTALTILAVLGATKLALDELDEYRRKWVDLQSIKDHYYQLRREMVYAKLNLDGMEQNKKCNHQNYHSIG